MERSPFTDEEMQSNPLDIRLQDLIVGWRGDLRGEPLSALHVLCAGIAGHDHPLLPKSVYTIKGLDSATLREALKRTSAQVRFQADPQGSFDAALVPVSTIKENTTVYRFIFAVEQTLALADQVALYAHAVGHLLLNYQARLLAKRLNLNPENGWTHWDRLAELRYVEKIRSKADRDVLESFPKLATLIEPPQESIATIAEATRDVVQRLRARGWTRTLETPYEFTAGRVLPGSAQRGRKRSVDVLLRASSSLPIAVLHVQRADETDMDATKRVQDAAERLAVPFAYLVGSHGTIHEFDYQAGGEPVSSLCADVPEHAELVERWLTFLGLNDDREILLYPYYQNKKPRYYQDAAINRALIAVLQARRRLREPRVLLTLATGTGKTHIAFQLLWKLKQKRAVRNVLFLADRSYLLSQAIIGDFAPLHERIWLGEKESKTSHDMLFASYQWLTKVQYDTSHYQDYPKDYFDVIIVDECHRGSANEDSLWRSVLEYFDEAVQVGLTATPLKNKEVQTSEYFGPSVYTYALSRGINDGFLAPYRVRRVLLGQESDVDEDAAPDAGEDDAPGMSDPLRGVAATSTLAEALVMETRDRMRLYTQTIAEHLAHYLEQSDPRAKTIVFCVDNEHAAQMRDALQVAAAAWARPGDIARIVDDDKQEGKLALDTFCSTEGQHPVVVTTSKLLSTGIDAPTCKNIVLARAVGSMVEFKQIIGRGTRLFGKVKTWFTILDYAGAMKHFFDPDFDGNPEFIVNEPLPPQASSQDTTPSPQEQTPTTAGTEGANTTEETSPAFIPGASEPLSTSASSAAQPEQTREEHAQGASPAEENTADEDDEDDSVTPGEVATPAYTFTIGAHSTDEPPYQAPASSHSSPGEQSEVKERGDVGGYATDGVQAVAGATPSVSSVSGTAGASANGTANRATPPAPREVTKRADGTRIMVQGELWFELGADGRRLRDQSQTLQDWAKLTLRNLVKTPQELGARWLEPLQRQELIDHLKDQIVALDVLAREMHLEDADPFDVLLQAVFGMPALTRAERVARLRQQHASFFARFEQNLLASEVVDAILNWYTDIPIPWDKPHTFTINDVGLLKVQPIASVGAYPQLVLALKGKEASVSVVLQELQRLLYSV